MEWNTELSYSKHEISIKQLIMHSYTLKLYYTAPCISTLKTYKLPMRRMSLNAAETHPGKDENTAEQQGGRVSTAGKRNVIRLIQIQFIGF